MTKVSIIVVHYKEKKVLYDCLRSIEKSLPSVSYEVVVVDNDEPRTIEEYLKVHFPKVRYIPAFGDLGYGKGNNLGIKNAKGEYIFIINPDTIVTKGMLDEMVNFIVRNKKVGAVAPSLYDQHGKVYSSQGTGALTPVRAMVGLSFINKLFPNNPISKAYWLKEIDRSGPYEVDVVPGTAFLIKKKLFEKLGGFDKNFFLYFEESDLCKRIREAGYKLYILPKAKLTHFWAVSTPPSEFISKVFRESRFYYFRKNFGLLNALLVEFFTRLNLYSVLLFLIFGLGVFLRFYQMQQNLLFSGEMGTDYINVWNINHGGRTFLLGPRTSHEWFYISPVAYWIYAIFLSIWKYNPVVINIFWGVVGSLAVLVCYSIVKKLFNKNVALISAFLLSVSPAWILQTRNARYNLVAAILFLPYFYYLKNSIEDKGKSLFKLGLILGLTMSFFPSPILLIPAVLVSFIFYKVRPKFKYIFYSIVGFIIPNLAFLVYELTNKFDITIKLLSWIPYRILGFFGVYQKNTIDSKVLSQNFYSIYQFFSRSFVGYEGVISIVIFIAIVISTIFLSKKLFKDRHKEMPFYLLIINLLVSYIGLFIHGNPPTHYYLVIFPIPLILAALIIDKLFHRKSVIIFLTLAFGGIGIFGLVRTNWFYTYKEKINYAKNLVPYSTQQKVTNSIIKSAGGNKFSLSRIGSDDQFENNFANNYIFLLTTRGAIIDPKSNIKFTIIEGANNYKTLSGTLIFSENEVYVYKTVQ